MNALDALSREDVAYLASAMRRRRDDTASAVASGGAAAAHELDVVSRVSRACQEYLDAREALTAFDDGGDDDLKDGGLGIPGYGVARDHDPMPL